MRVVFESVYQYLATQASVGDPAQGTDRTVSGDGLGRILEIIPPPKFECLIRIENADASDQFHLTVCNLRGELIDTQDFTGAEHRVSRYPDEYMLTIEHPTEVISPLDPLPVDLYDNCEVRFQKTNKPAVVPAAKISAVTESLVALSSAPDTEILLSKRDSPLKLTGVSSLSARLGPGLYKVSVRQRDSGRPILRRQLLLTPGESLTRDLRTDRAHPAKTSILNLVPNDDRGVDFSESLQGPVPDDDLALWASIIGGSQIVAEPSTFDKLSVLHLQQFKDVQPGESIVYVVSALAADRISLSLDRLESTTKLPLRRNVIKQPAQPVTDVAGMYQWGSKSTPGPHVLWIVPEQQASLALATWCLPNRATFIVLIEDAEKNEFSIRQFMLPIHNLISHLDPEVQRRLHPYPLQVIRFIATATARF